MAAPQTSIIDTRSAQMFFTLEPAEIERVRRFGTCRVYQAGEALANVGQVAQGVTIIISGGRSRLIVTPRLVHGRACPAFRPAGADRRLR